MGTARLRIRVLESARTVTAWPWPGDTPTERARRIANSLLALLPAEERPTWIKRAHELGETWLGETIVTHELDDVLTPADAGRLLAVTPAILRNWVRLGVLQRTGTGYTVKDLLDAAAEIRKRRVRRAGQT